MSIIKSIAKAVYSYAFTEAERKEEGKLLLSDADRFAIAQGYIARDGKLLDQGSLEFRKIRTLAEDFVTFAAKASSFTQMCRSQVRQNSGENYYLVAAVGRILEKHLPYSKAEVKGGETSSLLLSCSEAIEQAKAERNPIKRRALIRKAVKAQVKNLEGTELELIVDAVLLLTA